MIIKTAPVLLLSSQNKKHVLRSPSILYTTTASQRALVCAAFQKIHVSRSFICYLLSSRRHPLRSRCSPSPAGPETPPAAEPPASFAPPREYADSSSPLPRLRRRRSHSRLPEDQRGATKSQGLVHLSTDLTEGFTRDYKKKSRGWHVNTQSDSGGREKLSKQKSGETDERRLKAALTGVRVCVVLCAYVRE